MVVAARVVAFLAGAAVVISVLGSAMRTVVVPRAEPTLVTQTVFVSVRRLFIFLERSIYEGTQWVVFEPNDDRLWARVIDTIRLFLRAQWRLGALFGRTEQEAFFITCDRTTMSQDDILNGRLICEIGIAPVRPAEFVIFRIFQHTAEAQR